jgi:hypothetical protein
MRRVFFCIASLLFATSAAHAQFCPPGSRQVSNGGGIMCQCPDGSFAGVGGCRSAPIQPPRNAPINSVQSKIQFARQRINANAKSPAFNQRTHQWEQRQGLTRVMKDGDKIWYQTLDYSGLTYVYVESIACYIEVGTDDYPTIFAELSSGADDKIDAAIIRLMELAHAEGVLVDGGE